MNGFCGAVDYKKPNIDFDVLKRMCIYLGGSGSKELRACALPGCVMICASVGEEIAPVIRSCGAHDYMAVALVSSDVMNITEQGYVSESLAGRYACEGMRSLESIGSAVCGAIFNGAFGETVIFSGLAAEQVIYYTEQGNTLYFSDELGAVLSAVESYGGKIKINKDALRQHIMGADDLFAEDIFSDVMCVRAGKGITVSQFGITEFELCSVDESNARRSSMAIIPPDLFKFVNACRSAEAILDLFGYPQFDMYLPAIIERLDRALASRGVKSRWIPESISESAGLSDAYIAERARVLTSAYGISVRTEKCSRRGTENGASALRAITKELKKELGNERCALYELFDERPLGVKELLKHEKSTPRRVRLAGMLYQTSIWFKKYNISF